jgi:hypothetical protein
MGMIKMGTLQNMQDVAHEQVKTSVHRNRRHA